MKRTTLLALLALFLLAACAKPEKAPEKLTFGVFGEVLIYREAQEPGRTVLLLSEGPWDARMDRAARTIAANNIVNSGAMVLGAVLATGLSALGVPIVQQVLLSAAMCLISAWLGLLLYRAEQKAS